MSTPIVSLHETVMKDTPGLAVVLELADKSTTGQSCAATISVSSLTAGPVVVNGRLSVGYEDGLSREVFLSIRSKDGEIIEPSSRVDYNRDFSGSEDYVVLNPDECVETTFDLMFWYPLPPGSYSIIVHYQADEALALAASEMKAQPGIYSSEPVNIEIVPTATEK